MHRNSGPTNEKTALREHYKGIRAGLSSAQREADSKTIAERLYRLPDFASARSCFIYISCGSEVTTHEIIDKLTERGVSIAVPRIEPDKRMSSVRFNSWADCQPGQLGILTPSSGAEILPGPFDLVVTPGLAFTRSGIRLGFGAGYYDKWFSQNAVTSKIALAFSVQIANHVPCNEWDVPVDKIVTESEVIKP